MPLKKEEIISRLKAAFVRERVICRAVAAWCLYAMYTLLMVKGDFFELSFAQETSSLLMILQIGLFFIVLSAVSFLLPDFETDSWFLLP